jgi:hypothetical protein
MKHRPGQSLLRQPPEVIDIVALVEGHRRCATGQRDEGQAAPAIRLLR